MWYVLEDTVPANTAKADARETSIRVHGGILHSIIVTIPPGSADMVHTQLRHSSYYILPRNEDKDISGEHVNINYREWYEMKAALNTLTLVAWAPGTQHPHTIRFLIGVLPKGVLEVEEDYLKTLRLFMRLFRRRA